MRWRGAAERLISPPHLGRNASLKSAILLDAYNPVMSQLRQILLTETGYSAWATSQLLNACGPLTLEQLDIGLGASHSSILGTFRHIYDGERV